MLVGADGAVQAMWASFGIETAREATQTNLGVSIELVAEMLDHLRANRPLHTLDIEMDPQPLTAGRRLGLTDSWLKRLEQANPEGRQVLSVSRITGGAPAAKVLQQGDLVLALNDTVVTRFRDVERLVANLPSVNVTVWRGEGEVTVPVPTSALTGVDVDRVVQWAGATLQAPHRALSTQRGIVPEGVYVAFFAYGSPATRYRLQPGRRIVEVDGQPTPDLDAFLKVVSGRPDRSSVRLRTLTWNNAPEVITLKLDQQSWPTSEIVRGPDGWDRRDIP